MFEEVRSINWKELSHSHGTAQDVPDHLAALVKGTKQERDEALQYFWEYMLHQGSRYPASPYVVRFLFEALDHVDRTTQRQLIDMLLALAVGYGESFLPFGYDLNVEEQRYTQEEWYSLYNDPDARTAYYEVHHRAGAFARFLHPRCDPQTRLSAAFAIAHFAQPLASLHSEIAERLAAETHPDQQHSLMLCYGMLGRFAGRDADADVLARYRDDSDAPTIRLSAAIAETTLLGPKTPDPTVATLFGALNDAWEVTTPRDGWQWWNEGDLLGYAAMALRLVGDVRRDQIAAALCAALTNLEACTFSIPQTLLDVLFPEPKPHGGWQFSAFDDVQKSSLKVLLRSRHWKTWMIDSKFLKRGLTGEDYRNALQNFLREVGGDGLKTDPMKHAGNVSSWDFRRHWT